MTKKKADPRVLDDEDKIVARYLAIAVRNAMGEFHIKHLTDTQMAELNPIIRNALATALHALRFGGRDRSAQEFVSFQFLLIPPYWEEPAILDSYFRLMQYFEEIPIWALRTKMDTKSRRDRSSLISSSSDIYSSLSS